MSTIDIRSTSPVPVTKIVVAEPSPAHYRVDVLEKSGFGFEMQDTEAGRFLQVLDRETAENLIKGLQKAIELGWV